MKTMRNWIETITKITGYLLMSGFVWVLTGLCFVIGMIGVIFSTAVRWMAVGIYYLCEEIKDDYITLKRKAIPQVAYLCDFRNDILRECGRGDAYEYEDEF